MSKSKKLKKVQKLSNEIIKRICEKINKMQPL